MLLLQGCTRSPSTNVLARTTQTDCSASWAQPWRWSWCVRFCAARSWRSGSFHRPLGIRHSSYCWRCWAGWCSSEAQNRRQQVLPQRLSQHL